MALGWRGQYVRYKDFFLNVFGIYKTRPDLKSFLEIILSSLTISFFAIFALRPTLSTIAELLQEIKGREETEAKLAQKIKDLDKAKSVYNQEFQRIVLLNTAIASQPPVESFVNQIQALTEKNSATLNKVSIAETTLVGPEQKNDNPDLSLLPEGAGGMPFSVTAKGKYASFIDLFSDLENFRIPILVDTFGISKNPEEATLILAISGRTAYLAQEEVKK